MAAAGGPFEEEEEGEEDGAERLTPLLTLLLARSCIRGGGGFCGGKGARGAPRAGPRVDGTEDALQQVLTPETTKVADTALAQRVRTTLRKRDGGSQLVQRRHR